MNIIMIWQPAAKRDVLDVFRLYAADLFSWFLFHRKSTFAAASITASAADAADVALLTPGGADLFTKVGDV